MSDMTTTGINSILRSTFVWVIDDFELHESIENGEFICSELMIVGNETSFYKWLIKLFPNGDQPSNRKFITLSLELVAVKDTKIKVIPVFSILNCENQVILRRNCGTREFSSQFSTHSTLISRKEFVKKFQSPKNKLVVCCDLEYYVSDDVRSVQEKHNLSAESILSENYLKLFESNYLCDVTFYVGSEQFQAHKAILTARSPVFAAMFDNEMQEKIKNRVDITDAQPNVVKEMLRYIYCGNIFEIENIAIDLIKLADKYELKYLKNICEDTILNNMNVDNAADVLIIADLHSPVELKPRVLNFIKQQLKDFKENEKFEKLKKSHPQLLVDVFETWFDNLTLYNNVK